MKKLFVRIWRTGRWGMGIFFRWGIFLIVLSMLSSCAGLERFQVESGNQVHDRAVKFVKAEHLAQCSDKLLEYSAKSWTPKYRLAAPLRPAPKLTCMHVSLLNQGDSFAFFSAPFVRASASGGGSSKKKPERLWCKFRHSKGGVTLADWGVGSIRGNFVRGTQCGLTMKWS